MSEKSPSPERDELWARHEGLTPACCAEMIALAGKLEQERDEARKATISAKIIFQNCRAAFNTLNAENKRLQKRVEELKDEGAKAMNAGTLQGLKADLLEQDLDEVREIIARGGSASDVLRFLDMNHP
jgi:hypothetical protein